MNGIYVTIAETMGTDGEFYSEVYLSKTEEDAKKVEDILITDMCETMGIYDAGEICYAKIIKEVSGDGWWFRVRTEQQGFYQL
jgi:hypothetical protein